MNTVLVIALSMTVGAAIGGAYLMLLWVSLRSAVRVRSLRPVALGAACRILLVVIAGAGVVYLQADAVELAAGLVGFFLVRCIAVRQARPVIPGRREEVL